MCTYVHTTWSGVRTYGPIIEPRQPFSRTTKICSQAQSMGLRAWHKPILALYFPFFFPFAQGRSKSLTSIDALNPGGKRGGGGGATLAAMEIDLDSRSECGGRGADRLAVPVRCESVGGGAGGSPGRGYQRRRKLSTAGKVRKYADYMDIFY